MVFHAFAGYVDHFLHQLLIVSLIRSLAILTDINDSRNSILVSSFGVGTTWEIVAFERRQILLLNSNPL